MALHHWESRLWRSIIGSPAFALIVVLHCCLYQVLRLPHCGVPRFFSRPRPRVSLAVHDMAGIINSPIVEHPVYFQGCDHVFPLRYTTWTLAINSPIVEHPVFFQGCDHVFPLRYTTWTLKSTPPLWSTPFFFKAVTMFFPRGTQHGRLQSINKQESQLRYPICQIFQPTSRLYNNFTKQETTGYATCQIS